MNQEQLLEGNKLIAKFDGWVHFPTPKNKGNGYWNNEKRGFAHWSLDSFKYHSSWDWLMPVVGKINKLFDEESDNWLGKCLDDDFPKIIELRITESIKSVYVHVIQFIQWYNTQNKQP